MRKFYARTTPGLPADWDARAVVGRAPRRPLSSRAWFLIGLLVGVLLAGLARA